MIDARQIVLNLANLANQFLEAIEHIQFNLCLNVNDSTDSASVARH